MSNETSVSMAAPISQQEKIHIIDSLWGYCYSGYLDNEYTRLWCSTFCYLWFFTSTTSKSELLFIVCFWGWYFLRVAWGAFSPCCSEPECSFS